VSRIKATPSSARAGTGGSARVSAATAAIAIRENERAARAYGVDATRTTLAAFAFSGFLAALAGAFYVQQQNGLTADPYLPQRSLELFTMVVIGGLGSLPGALLGATYVHSADFFLPAEWRFLATGAGLLIVLLIFPSGLGGMLADLRDTALRRIARRQGMVVPSLLADVRVDTSPDFADEPPPEPVLEAAARRAEHGVTDGGEPADAVTGTPGPGGDRENDGPGSEGAEAGATEVTR